MAVFGMRKVCRMTATEREALRLLIDARRRAIVGPRVGRRPDALHGTRTRYTSGCRCTDCRAANTEYADYWRRGRL